MRRHGRRRRYLARFRNCSSPASLDGRVVYITASVASPCSKRRRAHRGCSQPRDAAMYMPKASVTRATRTSNSTCSTRRSGARPSSNMRTAIETDQLSVDYSRSCASRRTIAGFEALVRWRTPDAKCFGRIHSDSRRSRIDRAIDDSSLPKPARRGTCRNRRQHGLRMHVNLRCKNCWSPISRRIFWTVEPAQLAGCDHDRDDRECVMRGNTLAFGRCQVRARASAMHRRLRYRYSSLRYVRDFSVDGSRSIVRS